jgi:1-pyrroline dehydrogenase
MTTAATITTAAEVLPPSSRGHFINGEFVTANDSDGDPAQVLNPATNQPLATTPSGDAEIVDRAVAAARAAQPGWRRTPPRQRSEVLLRIAAIIDEHADELIALEAANAGKPMIVAREEIPPAADTFRFFAGACRTAQAPAPGEYLSGHLSFIAREPVGVVGAIVPWNYPLMMAAWKIAPAIAAGNTIVVKPSELTPLTLLRFVDLIKDEVPAGVINVVLGAGRTVGAALSAHPDVDLVALTGGTEAGKQVAASASCTLKRLHLELGGKAPFVVFPDADIDAAVETIKTMGYWNTGQECGSATRLLVHESIAEQVTQRLVEAVATIVVDDPAAHDDVEMGPLISAAQLNSVNAMVTSAVSEGAELLCGGERLDRDGHFYAPTVLRVQEQHTIARDEVFGPVVTVHSFATEDEAIAISNSVSFGLAASVWTTDVGLSLRLADALDFGTVWVNAHLAVTAEMPWGGFGESGYGRDCSTYGLDDYTRTKHIMINKG